MNAASNDVVWLILNHPVLRPMGAIVRRVCKRWRELATRRFCLVAMLEEPFCFQDWCSWNLEGVDGMFPYYEMAKKYLLDDNLYVIQWLWNQSVRWELMDICDHIIDTKQGTPVNCKEWLDTKRGDSESDPVYTDDSEFDGFSSNESEAVFTDSDDSE